MSRKGFTAEQIIHKLRQAEVELANEQRMAQVCRTLGISEQTYSHISHMDHKFCRTECLFLV